MYDFLAWLEASAVGDAVRSSGVWAYAVLNLTHVLGVAALLGSVLLLDLRLLGLWREIPLVCIERPTVPVAVAGFGVAAVSGLCMIATNATEYDGNPFLYVKFPAIAFAVSNAAVVACLPAWKARKTRPLEAGERRQLAVAGGLSLTSWLTAVAAARMIGYW